ncbi:MAG: fibronectin type III domain-containing protein [Planctomycetes bacterium]|nr:fibronectin type III domain-containing protein [Planctomycetota bacterium]
MKITKSCFLLAALFVLALGCGGGSPPAIAAPTNLKILGFTTTSVNLSWQDTSDNEDGFKIYRSTDGSTFTEVDTNILPSYNDGSVVQGQQYYYRVTAYNATDESAFSNTVTVIPEDYYVTLLAPNGAESLVLDDMFNITWVTNMPGFDARVLISLDGGSTYPAGNVVQFAWAPNESPIPWKVGYKNTENNPLNTPVWEQLIFSSNSNCVIRIRDYIDGAVSDDSDGVFTITVP